MKFFWDFSWPIVIVIATYAAYSLVIKPKLAEAAQVLGKSETVAVTDGWGAWIWAKIDGWKTIIVAFIGGLPQVIQLIPAEIITEWQQLPWGVVFEQSVANKISAACALLVAITHSAGILKAAKTAPQA
jgi:hypothetical protein